jgi:hypothetical protein
LRRNADKRASFPLSKHITTDGEKRWTELVLRAGDFVERPAKLFDKGARGRQSRLGHNADIGVGTESRKLRHRAEECRTLAQLMDTEANAARYCCSLAMKR